MIEYSQFRNNIHMLPNPECDKKCGWCGNFSSRLMSKEGKREVCRGGKGGLVLGPRTTDSPCPLEMQQYFRPLAESSQAPSPTEAPQPLPPSGEIFSSSAT
jgi:hypothetical protein